MFGYNFCADSYDDKAVTLKILQKLKLENFQVCFFGTVHTFVFQLWVWKHK